MFALEVTLDGSVIEALNRWFSASGPRVDIALALAVVPLFLIARLVVVAWLMDWGSAPYRRAILVLGGGYTPTHAAVIARVTQVTRELDGDVHIRLESDNAFIVAEIMPEFAMEPPVVGEEVTAWGVVRHDGSHNWWELHPLIG